MEVCSMTITREVGEQTKVKETTQTLKLNKLKEMYPQAWDEVAKKLRDAGLVVADKLLPDNRDEDWFLVPIGMTLTGSMATKKTIKGEIKKNLSVEEAGLLLGEGGALAPGVMPKIKGLNAAAQGKAFAFLGEKQMVAKKKTTQGEKAGQKDPLAETTQAEKASSKADDYRKSGEKANWYHLILKTEPDKQELVKKLGSASLGHRRPGHRRPGGVRCHLCSRRPNLQLVRIPEDHMRHP